MLEKRRRKQERRRKRKERSPKLKVAAPSLKMPSLLAVRPADLLRRAKAPLERDLSGQQKTTFQIETTSMRTSKES